MFYNFISAKHVILEKIVSSISVSRLALGKVFVLILFNRICWFALLKLAYRSKIKPFTLYKYTNSNRKHQKRSC